MNFGFTEEQELLRQEVRKFLDAHCPLEEVRKLMETPEGFSRDLWKQMGELGWIGLPIAEVISECEGLRVGARLKVFEPEPVPLARRPLPRPVNDPTLADRFELVINAKELANGYSELNDADDQMQRFEFEASLAAAGDVEAHPADMAFVQALQYGLPPTSGIGIGVDRLVMLLAEVVNIRDVILFPLLKRREGSREE